MTAQARPQQRSHTSSVGHLLLKLWRVGRRLPDRARTAVRATSAQTKNKQAGWLILITEFGVGRLDRLVGRSVGRSPGWLLGGPVGWLSWRWGLPGRVGLKWFGLCRLGRVGSVGSVGRLVGWLAGWFGRSAGEREVARLGTDNRPTAPSNPHTGAASLDLLGPSCWWGAGDS